MRRSSVTGLLGPSGSGKTTLLRAIIGVQIVESGEIEVLGLAAATAALRQRIGYVTQAPSVYADLTVAENVRYFARVMDVPTSEALAVSLLGAPELLVLDEPTVRLDPMLRLELWRSFHELADRGTTLLISTHVMDEATRCNELVLMRDGGIVAADTPSALLEQPGATDIEGAFLALAGEARVKMMTDAASANPRTYRRLIGCLSATRRRRGSRGPWARGRRGRWGRGARRRGVRLRRPSGL